MSEQTLILLALCLLSIGVAITGYFPFEYGLYATTVLMSIGFHYFETVNNSLTMQWINKEKTPSFFGKMIAIKSLTSLATYGAIWLAVSVLAWQFATIYLVFGLLGLALLLLLILAMPRFKNNVSQHKKLLVRKKYWLYYLLVFLSGARRQIFVVFAGFMMVEKFGYDASDMALLFIANHLASLYFAPKIGQLIEKVGEKRTLTFEYIGLIIVFSGYALVENQYIASGLYVIDHLFFAMAIALKTYFQKIADPKDIAATSGVSFTINHIAAVVIPAFFGIIWLTNPSLVFIVGAGIALCSLALTQLINLPVLTVSEVKVEPTSQ